MVKDKWTVGYQNRRREFLENELEVLNNLTDSGEDFVELGEHVEESNEQIDRDSSFLWQALKDLRYIGASETVEDGDQIYLKPLTSKLDDEKLSRLKDKEEYTSSLEVVDEAVLEQTVSWNDFDFEEIDVKLPVLPAEYVAEHLNRNTSENVDVSITYDDEGNKLYTVADLDWNTGWGNVEGRALVQNRFEDEEDLIKLEGSFYEHEGFETPIFSHRNSENYLGEIKKGRIDTLTDEVEEIYQRALMTAVGEIGFGEGKNLKDIAEDLSEKRPQKKDGYSIKEVIENSRRNMLEDKNGYYGDVSADRVSLLITQYLEDDLAPFEYQFSGVENEVERQDKGAVAVEIFYDALEEFAEDFYGEEFHLKQSN